MRKIDIVFAEPRHRQMKGIYRIDVGNIFYIGRAGLLANRMYNHSLSINKYLESQSLPESEKYHERIIRYLQDNPKIETMKVTLIQRCVTFVDLWASENSWLSYYELHPDCVNRTFRGSFVIREFLKNEKQDCILIDNVIHYFDPDFDGLIHTVESSDLTASGIPRKTVNKKIATESTEMPKFALNRVQRTTTPKSGRRATIVSNIPTIVPDYNTRPKRVNPK
jgi:hypothetical protein